MGFSSLLKKASLAGAFFVSAIWLSGAQAFCPTPGGLTPVAVQRVVDGDTLRLSDGRNVRMIGLNTPELGKQGRSDEPFAVAARKRLEALVAASDGRVGLVPGKESKDHYGRTLAHVYGADGANLEAQMLAEGLGFQVAVAPNVDPMVVIGSRTSRRRSIRGHVHSSMSAPAFERPLSGLADYSSRGTKGYQRERSGAVTGHPARHLASR